MLYSGVKKDALAIHGRAVEKYNATLENFRKKAENLYITRQQSVGIIEDIERLINSIANSPKDFEATFVRIRTERKKFRQTEDYAAEAYKNAIGTGAGVVAGVASGVAIASMAPTVAMWVATTFGTASTGTAISTLSGAVATKAALAWLGGGALAAGGGGVAAGQALLALAGPIGWGISAFTTGVSLVALSEGNKKISEAAVEEAKKITIAGAQLNEARAIVDNIYKETNLLLGKLKEQLPKLLQHENSNYSALIDYEQLQLGTLVNNALSLAALLNKTVE
jgi:hypothetical protein